MQRSRPALFGALFVVGLVLVAAGGLFTVQFSQATAACSEVPRPDTCAFAWPPAAGANALFASMAGLLAAIVLAITVGMNVRRDPAPNVALANQLEYEERYLDWYRQRRAQLDQWTTLAQAGARERQIQAEADQEAAIAAQAEAEVTAALSGDGSWQQEHEPTPEYTAEQRRRARLSERLLRLAKSKPEAVASVVSGWINQPSR